MEQKVFKYLKFVPLARLDNWSPHFLLGKAVGYTNQYTFTKIRDFLKRNKTPVKVQNGVSYKRPTIQMNRNGIKLRDIIDGSRIGTKNQFRIQAGQFLLSKIDARNGAFGVVPDELEGGIITGNFWTFDVDYRKINPHYLSFLTGTPAFQKLSQSASVGTTNRHYLQENLFLNFEVPLPSLEEQDALVAAYQFKLAAAAAKEAEAANVDEEIERYFLEQLGLSPFTQRAVTKGFQFVRFADLERWDAYATDNRVNTLLKSSPFGVKKLGTAYEFVNRGWNKRAMKETEFSYVEIGAVDPISGITEAKILPVAKAPSRASQIIKEGDLILGTTRPYLKKFALVSEKYDGAVASSGFAVIGHSTNYNLAFLRQFLVSAYGVEQLKNKMSGALYPAITDAALKEIKIPVPDVALQSRIMERVEAHRQEIMQARGEAEELRAAAIQEFEEAIFHTT